MGESDRVRPERVAADRHHKVVRREDDRYHSIRVFVFGEDFRCAIEADLVAQIVDRMIRPLAEVALECGRWHPAVKP